MMAKVMKWVAAVTFLLCAVFTAFVFAGYPWAISFTITFGTCFYHFAMRLMVGYGLNRFMKNRADLNKRWYQLRPFEVQLYKALKVKRWKANMPTFDPSLFDPGLHSWNEIAQAMCQAEIVHEIITVLSFLPLLAAIPFGSFGVFLITSVLSALYDLSFVVMQRYNRPRIMKFIEKERAAK